MKICVYWKQSEHHYEEIEEEELEELMETTDTFGFEEEQQETPNMEE
jgi:hypothetical protein